MCNGTRLLTKELRDNIIVATILTGPAVGQLAYIPRIPMTPTDLLVPFKRLPFPVKISFALTINKSSRAVFPKVVQVDPKGSTGDSTGSTLGVIKIGGPQSCFVLYVIKFLNPVIRTYSITCVFNDDDGGKVYKGLDIVTAKASPKERAMATHHLLDILEPHQMFTVVDFRNRALKLIDTLLEKAKVPIIVGGTNYYIESIVWNVLVETEDDPDNLLWEREGNIRNKRKRIDSVDDNQYVEGDRKTSSVNVADAFKSTTIELKEIDDATKQLIRNDIENESKFTKEELHAKLRLIDPVMAGRLHPNNRRKVVRIVGIHSEVLGTAVNLGMVEETKKQK
ncbi:tRNA dimethylallyltransferase [Eumeta japonica]|uniref:tRNA dimethylallyltransferase n=1 Tax=Eumeta variegata TaxID=151549 RepID=A0A4C1TZP6_EUMVA|nr:tRNA dimethylallyltransferase [Eumeta japonica]